MDNCEICKFWISLKDIKQITFHYPTELQDFISEGLCRRYPPKPTNRLPEELKKKLQTFRQHHFVNSIENFPSTGANEWCGEFKSIQN